MSFNEKDNKNLLLNQIIKNGDDEFKINEFVPSFSNDASDVKFLVALLRLKFPLTLFEHNATFVLYYK